MSITIGDVTFTEEELQDGFSAAEVFSTPGSRGDDHDIVVESYSNVCSGVVRLLLLFLTVSSGMLLVVIR